MAHDDNPLTGLPVLDHEGVQVLLAVPSCRKHRVSLDPNQCTDLGYCWLTDGVQ